MSTIEELNEATDEEFQQAIKGSMWKEDTWSVFMEDEVIDRTSDSLGSLVASIQSQLVANADIVGIDPTWMKRAKSLMIVASNRKGQANRRIKELNKAETAAEHADIATWRNIAEQLGFIAQGHGAVLDDIFLPRDGMSVEDWLGLRLASRDAVAA